MFSIRVIYFSTIFLTFVIQFLSVTFVREREKERERKREREKFICLTYYMYKWGCGLVVLFFLNALIAPIKDSEATFRIRKITAEEAKEIVSKYNDKQIISAVGHSATAQLMSMILGIPVNVNRVQVYFSPGDEAIVFSLNQRLPEGKVITSTQELEQIGYTLYHVIRVS